MLQSRYNLHGVYKMMSFKSALLGLAMVLFSMAAQAQIKGAGSTFAAGLYEAWSQSLARKIEVNLVYEPVGSGAGIRAAQGGSFDFGASDRPLARNILEQANLAQFPTAIGGVVILVNLKGIGADQVTLDGPTLAAIYRRGITKWNDPAIKALNPKLALPNVSVMPVFRTGGSGTSFIFTGYLAKVDPAFAKEVGVTSDLVISGGKGASTSKEVVDAVRSVEGGIGYVDFAFATDLQMPSAQMKNQWGTVVSPSRDSLQLAMRAADWERMVIDQQPTFEMDLTNAGCPGCWPIASLTYVLVPLNGKATNSVRVLEFFEQALRDGDALASREGYVPLPSRAKSVVSVSIRRWFDQLEKAGGGKARRLSQDGLPDPVEV
jgi:phosphate transport system substrate-binding protein